MLCGVFPVFVVWSFKTKINELVVSDDDDDNEEEEEGKRDISKRLKHTDGLG